MAVHRDLASLIRESLPEYLLVAEYCVKFRKGSTFPARQAGGCLGYPAAVMLFSIADTIGSFYRGKKDLNIYPSAADLVASLRMGSSTFSS